MRRSAFAATVFVFLTSVGPAAAGKIGFVDARRAVTQVDQGRAQLAELDRWAKPQREEILEMNTRVGELQGQLAKAGGVASEDALERLRAEETAARKALESAKIAFERQYAAKSDEFLADVAVKVGTIASDYAKANGFDAIFVLEAQPLIFVAEDADLTNTVVRLYNERFPAKK